MKRIQLLLLLLPTLLTAQDFDNIKDSLKSKYDYIGYHNKSGFAVARTKQQKYTLLDKTGKELFDPKYSYIHITPQGFFETGLSEGKKFKRGYINKDGSVRIPIIYDDVYMPSDIAIFAGIDGKKGVLDTLGNTVIPIKFDYILNADTGYYFASKNDLSALYHDSIPLTDFIFTDADRFKNNKAAVFIKDQGATVIDKSAINLIPPIKNHKITTALDSNAIIINQSTNKYGVIGFDGNFKIPCKYDRIETAGDNLIITMGEKKGLADLSGKEIIPVKYQHLVYYEKPEVFWAMLNNNEQLILDTTNKSVISGAHKNLYIYKDTYIIAEQTNGMMGIYSISGKVITTPQYIFSSLYDNYAAATKDGKCYVITLDGSKPPKLIAAADSFKVNFMYHYEQNGYVIFKKGKLYGLTTIDGNITVPAQYADLEYIYRSPEFVAKKNGKYGIVNTEGETIKPIIFDSFQLRKETVLLKKAGKKDVYHEIVFRTNLKNFKEAK